MTTQCDSRCTGAKGGACDCECGGMNHGGEARGQGEYFLGPEWTARKEGNKWVGVHEDGLVTPPVRTLSNLNTMFKDGRLDKYHDAKAKKSTSNHREPDALIVWGLPAGETDRLHERLLSERSRNQNDVDRVEAAASRDGFHSFRVVPFFEGEQPDFVSGIRKR